MSDCPPPLRILCRSLATSSSSSPIGLRWLVDDLKEGGATLETCDNTKVTVVRWIMCPTVHPPGLEAEVVLNENSNEEEDDALDGHSEQVFPHHVPGQR